MAIEQNTDTGAVIAMQEECDQLRERVRILREAGNALHEAIDDVQFLLEHEDDEDINDLIRALSKARTRWRTIEAAKEGA